MLGNFPLSLEKKTPLFTLFLLLLSRDNGKNECGKVKIYPEYEQKITIHRNNSPFDVIQWQVSEEKKLSAIQSDEIEKLYRYAKHISLPPSPLRYDGK